ncbi:hypothetical protein EDD22DRAFT_956802 [Suillus occidentalis]|nr:hypothetical protein EDD22DRAFT_956802 [Suillus occidentalis]
MHDSAEAEVDMLYDTIVRIAEFEATDDGTTSSGTAATSESYSPNDWFDWSSTSSPFPFPFKAAGIALPS